MPSSGIVARASAVPPSVPYPPCSFGQLSPVVAGWRSAGGSFGQVLCHCRAALGGHMPWGHFPGRDVRDHRCRRDLGLGHSAFGSLWLSSWRRGERVRRRGALCSRFLVSARADGVTEPWGQPRAEGQRPEGGGSLACRFLGLRMRVLPHPWPGWRCAGQRGGGRQAAGAGPAGIIHGAPDTL